MYECRVDRSTRLIYDVSDRSLRCWYVGEHDTALSFAAQAGERSVLVDDIEIGRRSDVSDLAAFLFYARLPDSLREIDLESFATLLDLPYTGEGG
jgi:hypothetical protein